MPHATRRETKLFLLPFLEKPQPEFSSSAPASCEANKLSDARDEVFGGEVPIKLRMIAAESAATNQIRATIGALRVQLDHLNKAIVSVERFRRALDKFNGAGAMPAAPRPKKPKSA